MGSGNGRPGTQQKLNRFDLEDFNPHRDEEPSEDDSSSPPDEQPRSDASPHEAAVATLPVEESAPRDEHARRSPAEAYKPLGDFLESFGSDSVMISFAAIENMIKRKLPISARQRETWWTNRPRGQGHARAWRDLGWLVEGVDLKKGRVTFTRLG
jgi:hypothetical protein